MADRKFSALPVVTPAANDLIPIVQVSSGDNKAVQVQSVFASPAPIGSTTPNAGDFTDLSAQQISVPGTSGSGIDMGGQYGWHDITAEFTARTTGAQVPSFVQYGTTGIYQYQFSNGATQELFIEFHIPHDYVPGSDLFIHTHWSQAAVDTGGAGGTPGNVKWNYSALYAKGFNQQAFQSSPVVVSAVQTAASVARQHMIAEVQLSTGGAIGGNALEVDGVILVRMWRDPADAADTLNVAPFAHFCDLHYQSTNVATPGKAPAFYNS